MLRFLPGIFLILFQAVGAFALDVPKLQARVTDRAGLLTAEQIDALETLATNPVQYLVVPRLVAAVVMLPAITILADVVGTAGGYILFFRLLARCGAGFASSCNFLIPLVGVAWGVLLLGEQPSPNALAALALILVGLAMPRLWPGRRAAAGR